MLLLCGAPRRDGAVDAAERSRSVRERLGAAVSGLSELELLRQRQEVLVRAALERREEKLLEENILLLRKQLSCLRMRDAGLISQLQELDRQINELRLDAEPAPEQPEADSRPSSGFYELSDAASASLSNSSNSVFSECFCTAADADGRLPSSHGPADCLECDGLVGGLCDDSSSSETIRRSLSALCPPPPDAASVVAFGEIGSKHLCDLVTWNGSETYHFPNPLHALVVQSPARLQGSGGQGRDEVETAGTSSPPGSVVPQSSSWPALSSTQTVSYKRLDGYIYSLLQRRAQPVRTGRPRTSISTEPSKSILRQASLCARQLSGPGPGLGRGSELKPPPLAGGTSVEGVAAPSPQGQRSLEGKGEEQEIQNVSPVGGDCSSPRGSVNKYNDPNPHSLLRKRSKGLLPHVALLPRDFREPSSPKANSSPTDTDTPRCPPAQELRLDASNHAETKNNHRSLQTEGSCRAVLELDRQRSSKQSPDDKGGGHMVHRRIISTQQRRTNGCKGGGRNVKPPSGKSGVKSHLRSKKSRLLEDGSSAHIRVSRRSVSSRMKRPPASIPEGRVLDRPVSGPGRMQLGVFTCYHHGNHHHHHHHGRDPVVVVARPKYRCSEYYRLRAPPEAPCDEAFGPVPLRQRKEHVSGSTVCPPSTGGLSSPYSYTAGSDSEYSAECASLFHSTIMDTSEDESSNYTTNCFGDSESGEDESVGSTTTGSDTEESGGGGGGAGPVCRRRGQSGPAGARAAGQERIKASRSLKKKILRFRSGSLKLMTTV